MGKLTFGSVLVVVLGLLVMVISGPTIFSSNPYVCGYCHQALSSTWQKSSHAKASCINCHQELGLVGSTTFKISLYSMGFSFISGNYDKPVKAEIENTNCLGCHETVEKKAIVAKGIRVSHKEFLSKGYRCTYCHNTVAHSTAVLRKNLPEMDKCSVCHNGERASKDCAQCHTTEESKRPTQDATSVWSITHGPAREKTHGMGDLKTCNVCHGSEFCIRCHQIAMPHPEGFPGVHGKKFLEVGALCDRCHSRSFCEGCHETTMPHYAGFLSEHAKIVRKEGKQFCLRCHLKRDCNECHSKHKHTPIPSLTLPKEVAPVE